MKLIVFLFCFLPLISSTELNVTSNDCWTNGKDTINDKYKILLNFSPKISYENDQCSIHLTTPLFNEFQNGFGIFLTEKMDCSSTLTVECLSNNSQINTFPTQFTCHTSTHQIEMPCHSISLTYRRNTKMKETRKSTSIQILVLAKEPCVDTFSFTCGDDYSNSCVDKEIRCNGRSECPSGYDEFNCRSPSSAGIPLIVIILIVLAFLFLLCILSSILICCCCRAACNQLIRRFRSKKDKKTINKGDVTAMGEDAGLIKGLTQQPGTVIEVLPQQHTEPAPLIIDSTKPIYPRLS